MLEYDEKLINSGMRLEDLNFEDTKTLRKAFATLCDAMEKHEHHGVRASSIWIREFTTALTNALDSSKEKHLSVMDQMQGMCNAVGHIMSSFSVNMGKDKEQVLIGSSIMAELVMSVFTGVVANLIDEPDFDFQNFRKSRKKEKKEEGVIGFLPSNGTVH